MEFVDVWHIRLVERPRGWCVQLTTFALALLLMGFLKYNIYLVRNNEKAGLLDTAITICSLGISSSVMFLFMLWIQKKRLIEYFVIVITWILYFSLFISSTLQLFYKNRIFFFNATIIGMILVLMQLLSLYRSYEIELRRP